MLLAAENRMDLRQPAGCGVLALGVGFQANAATLQAQERLLHVGQDPRELLHLGAANAAAVFQLELGVGHAALDELGPHLFVGLHVVGLGLALDNAKQRRLSAVD